MSGNLRLVEAGLPALKHKHVDIVLESGMAAFDLSCDGVGDLS